MSLCIGVEQIWISLKLVQWKVYLSYGPVWFSVPFPSVSPHISPKFAMTSICKDVVWASVSIKLVPWKLYSTYGPTKSLAIIPTISALISTRFGTWGFIFGNAEQMWVLLRLVPCKLYLPYCAVWFLSLCPPFLAGFRQNSIHDVYMQCCWAGIIFHRIGTLTPVVYPCSNKIFCCYSHYFSIDFDEIRYMGVYIE